MKKLLFSALAVVVTLFATNSCVREPNYIEDPSQGVTVSYSVTLDQVQKTKTTLAELDDIAVDKLFYSVYQLTGTNTYTAIDHSDYHKAVDLSATGTADVTVKLIKGETYKVVFWAQKGTAYVSTIDKDHPLGEITIDYTASDSYAADRDAFTAFDVITLDSTTPGTDYSSTFSKEIHLKRPFAQINFGADDVAQAAVQGYAAYSSVVAVKQAASKFNVTTGEASTPVDATFKSTVLPEVAVNFDINNVTYQRVAKAFVLPEGTFTVSNDGTAGTITSPLSTTPEVSLTLTVKKGENSLVLDPRSKSSVTVRSNYRTNLLGHLITTDATFQVVVDNDYEGSTDHVSIVSLGNASGNNEITMGDAEGISSDINFGEHPVVLNNTLTINGDVTISNGASLTVNAAIEVAEGATLTLDNVTIDNASTAPQIKVSKGATLIINGGTYTATDVDQLFNLLTSTISPAKIGRRDNSTKGELIIRGGTFMGDPTAYVDTDHYTVTDNNDGTFTVAQKPVTLTVEAGDVSMKMGDAAVLKTLTVDPADTDLSGISFEYSVANVASASYDPTSGKISVNAVGVGSTVVTVKVGTATATINVAVGEADSISVDPASVSVKVNETSSAVTVTLNNEAIVSSVASNNANCTVNWTSGNTFTVTGAAIGESVVTVTASNSLTATVAVTVSKADAVKLSAPVLSTENATADETSIMLTWTAVANASGYAVSYGAESPVNVTDPEVTLSGLALATNYTISVVAKGDGDAYTDSDASNAIVVSTDKGTVTIALVADEFNLIEGTIPAYSQATINASVKYGQTEVQGATLTYSVKQDDMKGNVSVSDAGVITAGAGEAAATIYVNYAGNTTYKPAQAEVTVGVSEKALESISLNTELVKKTFELNEEFTHNNIVVTANYNNGTTGDVTAGATFSEVDMTTAGEKTVTVSYGGKSATYNITVNAAVVNPVDQTINLTIGGVAVGETVNKVYGDASFTVVGSANNAVTFTSGTTSVAEITEAGVVTIKAVGSTVITATAAASAEYNETTKTFTLVVAKADLSAPTVQASAGTDKKITVSWDAVTGAASYTVKIGETETANATSPFVTAALENGAYAVSVKAIGDANHNDSAYSTAQSVEIADAQTPTDYMVPSGEPETLPYSAAFKADGQGRFAEWYKVQDEAVEHVWTYSSSYGMKASAYVSNTNHATEAWLYSPYVTIPSTAVTPVLTFKHALNKFGNNTTDISEATSDASVWIREAAGEWSQLNVTYPDAQSWTFVSAGSVALDAYKGKNIQIAFKYVSSTEKAGTWEIDEFSIEDTSAPIETTISFSSGTSSENPMKVAKGAKKTNTVTTNNTSGSKTYVSNNTAVATVDSSTGEVTGVAAGTTTITLTIGASGRYTQKSESYYVEVTETTGGDTHEDIVFNLDLSEASTYPDGFPTASGTKSGTHVFTASDDENYDFAFSCNTGYYKSNGYLMIGKSGKTENTASIITLPAIANYKLSAVKITASSGVSTNVKAYVSTGFDTGKVSDADWQFVQNGSSSFTISGTSAGVGYKLYMLGTGTSTYNAQLTKLELTYTYE
ncbi:MAG: choice-of-anchor J domain-containing protein [Bacteroidales bacterium]|nr:choice-of-anchor J domain-containing protein [Bacteroidales bacterium]